MNGVLPRLLAGLLCWSALAPESALAAGEAGSVAVSAERLIGVQFSEARQELADGSRETERWFGLGHGWSGGSPLSVPYEARRIGADVFPVDNASLGASLAFAYRATDAVEYWEMVLATRVGYLIPTTEHSYLWLRAGPYYHRSNLIEGAERGFGLGGEAALTVMFLDNVGLNATPAFDHSLSVERAGYDRRYRSLSFTFGLVGWVY